MIPDMEGRDVIAQPIRSPNRHRRMKLRDLAISYPTDSHTALPLLASVRAWASLSKMPIPFFCHVNDGSPPKVHQNETRGGGGSAERHRPSFIKDTANATQSDSGADNWSGAWGCQFRMEARCPPVPFGCPSASSALCYVHVV